MSLGIIIKSPEGLVLAAESRVTLGAQINSPIGSQQFTVNFDNANKLLSFNEPFEKFGVVTYGLAVLGGIRTAQSLLPEFESTLGKEKKLSVLDFSKRLSDFFNEKWKVLMPSHIQIPIGQGMYFNVAGFDDDESYGKVFQFEIPGKPEPVEQNPKLGDKENFGIIAGGQNEIMARLLLGYDPRLFNILLQNKIVRQEQLPTIYAMLEPLKLQVPIQLMPLQDCINLAVLLIRTTIDAQSLSIGIRGCGGAIDVALIKKSHALKFIQEKIITVN